MMITAAASDADLAAGARDNPAPGVMPMNSVTMRQRVEQEQVDDAEGAPELAEALEE